MIRPARSDVAPALALLHVEVWEAAYGSLMPAEVFTARRAGLAERVDRWREILRTSPARTLVALDPASQRLLGFSSDGPARDDDLAGGRELWALYVDAAAWGTGVGHALIGEAIGEDPASLWVLRGNDRALAFYARHGFALDGVERSDEYGVELRMVRG